MLQIRVNARERIAGGVGEPVDHRHSQAPILRSAKDPHSGIGQGNFVRYRPGLVGRIIVYNQDFVIDANQGASKLFDKMRNVFSFVQRGRDH